MVVCDSLHLSSLLFRLSFISISCDVYSTQLIARTNEENVSVQKASTNIKVENFRPNLLVAGGTGKPHQEDSWSRISFRQCGMHVSPVDQTAASEFDIDMEVTGPCPRCSMVNVDGSSGSMDCRVFQALSTYRREDRDVYFGQFCALRSRPRISIPGAQLPGHKHQEAVIQANNNEDVEEMEKKCEDLILGNSAVKENRTIHILRVGMEILPVMKC